MDHRGTTARRARTRWQQVIHRVLLALWLVAALVAVAMLMANHLVAMPVPEDERRLRDATRELLGDDSGLRVLHVIAQDCSCTRGLLDALIARRASPEQRELVLFIGRDVVLASSLESAGYVYREATREQLSEQLGIEAAPLLVILADDDLAYVGGYYREAATVRARDAELLERVRRGERPDPLPLYGCAVSDYLREAIDPLGISKLR